MDGENVTGSTAQPAYRPRVEHVLDLSFQPTPLPNCVPVRVALNLVVESVGRRQVVDEVLYTGVAPTRVEGRIFAPARHTQQL